MDDEETIRFYLEKYLSIKGYEVTTVSDGREAVSVYKDSFNSGDQIDLVLMDLTIPGGMAGDIAARKIMEIDPNAKVIVSSGYSHDPIMSEFAKYGFIDVLKKPYNSDELIKKIREHL